MPGMANTLRFRDLGFALIRHPMAGFAMSFITACQLLAASADTLPQAQGFFSKKILPATQSTNTTPMEGPKFASELNLWRRTATGWESTSDWNLNESRGTCDWAAAIHPAVIASFTVLTSLAALCGITGRSPNQV